MGTTLAIAYFLLLYFTLLYFIHRLYSGCRGEMKLTISSKSECLERGDAVCLQCLFDTCNPSFSLSPSRFEACRPGVVCLEGQLVGGHACQMSKPLDYLLFKIVVLLYFLYNVHRQVFAGYNK